MESMVARLHGVLLAALKQSQPNALERPIVSVAEIYQDLVPYRSVRTVLGFALNADYEHVLLRLLAGEDGLARIEPVEVREALRLELESPNPNVGLFRNYAACEVWLTVPESFGQAPQTAEDSFEARLDAALGSSEKQAVAPPLEIPRERPPRTEAEELESALKRVSEPESIPDPVTTAPPANRTDQPVEPAARAASKSGSPENSAGIHKRGRAGESAGISESGSITESGAIGETDTANESAVTSERADSAGSSRCVACEAVLPEGRLVRFCPQCGRDQTRLVCGSCGDAVEKGWRFCVTCGAEAGGS